MHDKVSRQSNVRGKKIGIINYVRHISISLHLNYKDKDIYEYPLCGVKKIK